MTRSFFRLLPCLLLALLISACSPPNDTIVLRGASQFDDAHSFNRTLLKFEELVREYYGKPIDFELYRNSELGLEKDYFSYMSQGLSVDFALISPGHMSTFSPAAPIMDMPFLFQDIEHWNRVLASDAFLPIANEVEKKADVKIIGYMGGGVRHLIVDKPVTNMAELKGLAIRVMGAPIQTQIFQAISAAPTVISYDEIYNAIQTGVIDAAENEATGIRQMKFYEVGPHISLTGHAITVRPLCFSKKTFDRLPEDLQTAILRAGKEAALYGREIESKLDSELMAQMEAKGLLTTHKFVDRDQLLKLTAPVKQAFAQKVGASDVLAEVNRLR